MPDQSDQDLADQAEGGQQRDNAKAVNPRRHDLDALRAVAMLLGIALHAGLSFMPGFWPVQDTHQNDLFGLMFGAIHGFRMPLFFVVSGFFTAMLIERRGLRTTWMQRTKRIFIPLLLGVFTVVPAVSIVSVMAMRSMWNTSVASEDSSEKEASNDVADEVDDEQSVAKKPDDLKADEVTTAINSAVSFFSGLVIGNINKSARSGDVDAVQKYVDEGADLEKRDPIYKLTPLAQAALYGHADVVDVLIEAGADVNTRSDDGGTPLITAAFFGHADVVESLVAGGADVRARNKRGEAAYNVIEAPWEITDGIAKFLKVDVTKDSVDEGRARVASLLVPADATLLERYQRVISRPVFATPAVHHLWFLWFLCWLCVGLFIVVGVGRAFGVTQLPAWCVLSPIRFAWLIPLTMLPQWIMGVPVPHFGPDTSAGLLPMPHLLFYYWLFFAFGAWYWTARDSASASDARLGRYWLPTLAVALFVVYPVGLDFSTGSLGFRDQLAPQKWQHLISVLLQTSYAWMMSFACIGLFRRLLSHESRRMRYVSDSSYWLYVAHLPLVIALQWLVREWNFPSGVKFAGICVVTTALLLVTYEYLVRYRWLGRLLNGPRQRPRKQAAIVVESAA